MKAKAKIKILIADDHPLMRQGLATLLNADPGLQIVGEAKNGADAAEKAVELKPDVIVMDLSMPVMDGVEATRRISEANLETKVLILTTYGTSADIAHAIDAGASGALVKDAEYDRLVAAIRAIADGGTAFSPEIETMLRKEPHPPTLTERQRQILELTIDGLSAEEISKRLNLSPFTVNEHLDAVRRKLGAANRAEAIAIALKKHLLKI